jgi:hypothetical protein
MRRFGLVGSCGSSFAPIFLPRVVAEKQAYLTVVLTSGYAERLVCTGPVLRSSGIVLGITWFMPCTA